MSQVPVKGTLGKKTSANKTGPDVLNRKKMVAPRSPNTYSLEMQQTKSSNSAEVASASISKLPSNPSSASTPTGPTPLKSTTKTTCNSSLKSTTSASMPKPTTTTTTSPTPTPTTTTTSPTPTPTTPTPTPTIPTPSPTPTPATLPASDPLHTSNNTATMSKATPTQPPTSSHVNTSTTTLVDPVEESDVFQTVSTRPDGRIAVTVLNKILMPTDKCATIISDSFCERVDPEGYRWAAVSQNIKDFYWDEFKKNCFWEEQDDAKVMTAWKTKASVAYSQYVFNMRNPKRNKTKKKPNHVSQQIWASWWEKWNSEDFKKISDQNKVNRRNGVPDAPARPTHTSGSASHLKIASKLKRSLGCEPAHSDFFLYTHTKNHDGENFITEKDRHIHTSYLEKREELEATGEDVDDDSVFYEVVGGHDQKRRLYGFGSYGKLILSKKGSNDTYYTPETNAKKEIAEKNAELAKLKELVTAQKEQNEELKELIKMQADQLKTQNEQNNSKVDKLEQQLQQFFDSLKRTE